MTNTPAWPGEPGVPLNPEQDRAHQLRHKQYHNEWVLLWDAEDRLWFLYNDKPMSPEECAEKYGYLGPCLTPAEVAQIKEH